MATIRRHYDALRRILGALMTIYAVLLSVQVAVAMRNGTQVREAERIQQLERRVDRLDQELERLDIPQRLTRIETYIETTKEAQAANRQMFILIMVASTLIMVGVILILVGRGPPAYGQTGGTIVKTTVTSTASSNHSSNFDAAVAHVLKHEGSRFVENPAIGEVSKFGITANFLRSVGLPHDRETVRNLTRERAIEIYRTYWWDRYRFDRIRNQRVATKVFDLAVNMGAPQAVKLLQRALIQCGAQLNVDGVLGESTIAAVNAADADKVLIHLRERAARFYRALAARDPKYQPFLRGWLQRANA